MDENKQKVNELTMRTLGSHYGGYTYVKVGDRQTDVKIDWQLLRAIEKGEVELLTSNIRHSYGEINFERYPRPVEVEGEDKH